MKIQIIVGSTRPGRIGPQIAEWIKESLATKSEIDYEVIDLGTQNLPMFDEPIHPSMNQYTHDHTKAWSEKIKQGDAYIFLTPEYNAGYPASLKNAIDYLYHEWTAKPVMIVSYGAHGGTSAAAQLLQIAERLKMKPTPLSPALSFSQDMFGEDGQFKDIAVAFKPYQASLEQASEELINIASSDDTVVA